jgi:hypothetical protein
VTRSSAQSAVAHRVALTCHPATPCPAVQRIEVEVRETAGPGFELRYLLEGDIERLLIPARSAPRRADRLWRHTCFEAFLAAEARAAYFEYNLAPSEEWALYRFSAYREGMAPVEPARAPRIRLQATPRRLQLDAEIDAPLAARRIALSAVVEDVDRRLSHWALAHPLAKPDFHHPDAFTLRLGHAT